LYCSELPAARDRGALQGEGAQNRASGLGHVAFSPINDVHFAAFWNNSWEYFPLIFVSSVFLIFGELCK
jgi:hypothetical protein